MNERKSHPNDLPPELLWPRLKTENDHLLKSTTSQEGSTPEVTQNLPQPEENRKETKQGLRPSEIWQIRVDAMKNLTKSRKKGV